MVNYDLDGRVILVTGGTSGIGRGAAERCAASGARVVICGTHDGRLAEVADAIAAAGGTVAAYKMDVRSDAETAAAVAFAADRFGRLDGAFNSAGISGPMFTPILDLDGDVFDEVMHVNVKGVWLSMKHQIRQMLTQGGGGSIVNASSVAGLVGTRVNSAYGASKHAVSGLSRSVALEYADRGIRVNALCPGWIETPMTAPVGTAAPDLEARIIAAQPLGRAGTPTETGEAVAWLLSDAASFVTGACLPVDGGRTTH